MTLDEIQTRLDKMPAVMSAKGLKNPVANFTVGGNVGLKGLFMWEERKGGFNNQFSHHNGETTEGVLASMEAWIANLPTAEEAKARQFTEALAAVIELGHDNGIDVQFVNPLTEAMKRLSENAITHKAA